jgi:hypothetical protein
MAAKAINIALVTTTQTGEFLSKIASLLGAPTVTANDILVSPISSEVNYSMSRSRAMLLFWVVSRRMI